MKKYFLLLVCVVMAVSVSAQEFGVKAGYNAASMSFDNDDAYGDDYDNCVKSSFYVGVFAEFELSDKFAVQPEIIYSGQGDKAVWEDGDDYDKYTMKANYLNIPIIAKYEIFDGFSVNVGPQFGFLLGEFGFLLGDVEMENAWDIEGEKGDESVDLDSQYINTFDFSIAVGLEYDITERLDVSVRYNIGLTDVMDIDGLDCSKNGVWQVGLGFKIF